MKKINARHSENDRVVCVSVCGRHEFYFQPARSCRRYWMFDTDEFSGAVWMYFKKNGRRQDEIGYSLTLREIYDFNDYRKRSLASVMKRIPTMVEYVIREAA